MPVPVLDLAAEYRSLRGEIDAAIARVIDRTAFVGGEEVAGFESEFAPISARRTSSASPTAPTRSSSRCRRSTSAPGDAVLTVPFTFAATVEAIVRCGATPLFVDIGDDYTIDVDAAAALLATRPVKAIIAVHLYGQPADLDRLAPLARRHGAALIEDAAQAHGAWCTVARRAPAGRQRSATSAASVSTRPRISARSAMPGPW